MLIYNIHYITNLHRKFRCSNFEVFLYTYISHIHVDFKVEVQSADKIYGGMFEKNDQ